MYNEEPMYQRRVVLFIQDESRNAFMVYPHINPISTYREKWCLPTGLVSGDPDNTLREAKRLAFSYYSVDIDLENFINYFVEFDEYTCLVTNHESSPGIESLFDQTKEGYRAHYASLDVKQAPLERSGLDHTQKGLLIRAGLLKQAHLSENNCNNVVSFHTKRNRLCSFHPKPL